MLRICARLIKTCAPAGRPAPLYLFFAILGAASAQQVVAPTPEQVGPPRGDNVGNYNITQSFETGYRFSVVSGDIGEYRSVVNYGNGIRLLGSNLSINSKDGHGKWFDEILLNTIGLGNDPYQSVTLRVAKNGLYQYNMTWRLDDYFNPGTHGLRRPASDGHDAHAAGSRSHAASAGEDPIPSGILEKLAGWAGAFHRAGVQHQRRGLPGF